MAFAIVAFKTRSELVLFFSDVFKNVYSVLAHIKSDLSIQSRLLSYIFHLKKVNGGS